MAMLIADVPLVTDLLLETNVCRCMELADLGINKENMRRLSFFQI